VDHLLLGDEFARRKERLVARARGRVLDLEAQRLDDPSLEPGAYDTIVLVHVLCGAIDVDATLHRIDELLAPGGQLLVLEHVRGTGLRGRSQDAWAPLWRHAPFGCVPNRDPLDLLRRNGFAVTDCDRFRLSRSLPIVAPYVSVVAVRKAKPPVEEARSE
jgi:SAM-dependent methyltransferase